jgi:recombination protein RecR
MDSLRRLEEIFSHFPGIGPRQARRFVHYLQSRPATSVNELVELINKVKTSTTECLRCHRFFIANDKKSAKICSICDDPGRDQNTLMVVARDSDFENVEKSGVYKGLYFVLGGTVPILDKEPEKRIRLKTLLERIGGKGGKVNETSAQFKEVILSLNTTPDGEHTADIVKDAINKTSPQLKVSILGRGLSTGAELEYADSETIKNALTNRH